MIDITMERVLSLSEACGLLPRRRRGKKPSYACLWRWATKGCRGIRLESIKVGGTSCTSVEALQRFCEAVTAAENGRRRDPSTLRTTAQRERRIRRADEHLRREGLIP